MRKTVYTCDRCDTTEPVQEDQGPEGWSIFHLYDVPAPGDLKSTLLALVGGEAESRHHLCFTCTATLRDWFSEGKTHDAEGRSRA